MLERTEAADTVARAVLEPRTSEVRYRRLFQTARDGILILDADTGQIIDANPFMTELLGYSFEEFFGREFWEISPRADKQMTRGAYGELCEHGYLRRDHLAFETKAGGRAEVEIVCNTYLVDDQRVAQCNLREIGERSRLEQKLKKQAEALAEEHRLKDEFIAMLSHELRNPLAPIANAVQLLRLQTDESPLQRTARSIIERQLAQMTRLIEDLMEVSRITTGRIRLQFERVDANGILDRAVESGRPLVDQHGHDLEVRPSVEPIWLNADAARLEQVFVNLLNNAAKYTPDGGQLALSVYREGGECVLRVRDTGVGISPELLPRIFDLFTQEERSLDRSQGGLGIGLALVKRLVELHGGRVGVRSSLGEGSEFEVHLPLAAPEAAPPATVPAESLPTCGPSLRVLVVDDNPDAAESLAMLLKYLGHSVRLAHTGPAAVAAAIEFEPNVALLDIGLPEFDGYKVAKRLRQNPALANTVLVATTGYGREPGGPRPQEAGFDHYLVKPLDIRKIREILANAKAAGAALAAHSS